MKYRYNNNELLYLSRQGCPVAKEYLTKQYYQYVKMVVKSKRPALVNCINDQDLIQNTIMACIKALDCYREDKDCTLDTYIGIVVKSQIWITIRKFKAEKEYVVSGYCKGDTDFVDESDTLFLADKKVEYQPNKRLVVKESMEELTKNCNENERRILQYRMAGYKASEIALLVGVSVKTVYNTMYQIRQRFGFAIDYKRYL